MTKNDIVSMFKNRKFMKAHGNGESLFFKLDNPDGAVKMVESSGEFSGDRLICYVGGYSYRIHPSDIVCTCSKSEFDEHDKYHRMCNSPFWN